jgi:hypothetical protein
VRLTTRSTSTTEAMLLPQWQMNTPIRGGSSPGISPILNMENGMDIYIAMAEFLYPLRVISGKEDSMFSLGIALLIISTGVYVITTMLMMGQLQKRKIPINWFLIRLYLPRP